MRVILREARETDMPLIRKLTVETGWRSMAASDRKSLNRETWSKHMVEVFEHFLQKEDSRIVVAEDKNHDFIGYLFVGESTNQMTGQTSGFIYDIYVTEKHRDKGVGTTLMKEAENYCKQKGYTRISLMVSTHNQPAIELYRKTGFKDEQIFMEKELH
jgi:ribosomal protein S18 acetylase RimI-like enzyme